MIEASDSLSDPDLYRVRPDTALCNRVEPGCCMNAVGGRILYFDDDHLSNAGAALVVPSIAGEVGAIRQQRRRPARNR